MGAVAIVAECNRLHDLRAALYETQGDTGEGNQSATRLVDSGIPGISGVSGISVERPGQHSGELSGALDWGAITPNRLRQWASIVRRLSAQALGRYPEAKRYTFLLAFLVVRAEEITNIIIEMFDQLVGRIFDRCDDEAEQTKVERARFLQTSARHLRRVAEVITNESIPDEAVRAELLRYLPREQWTEQKSLYDAFERGEVTVLFSLLARRYKHLRAFAPAVLDTVSLSSPLSSARQPHPLVDGLHMLAALGAHQGREGRGGRGAQVPASATTAFVPTRWKAAITTPAGIDRRAWESTLMHEVRGALRSGDLAVAGSRRYAAWDTDLYSRAAWEVRRASWYRENELPEDGSLVVARLKMEVHAVLQEAARALDTASGASRSSTLGNAAGRNGLAPQDARKARIEADRLVMPSLEALPVSAEALHTRARITQALPRPGLPDLLQEVDRWTGFSEAFFHLGSHRRPSEQQVREMLPPLYAAILAEGTNLGVAAMAQASGMREGFIQRAIDWYVREETLREAITRLIQYHRSLPLAAKFGQGTTSSSDGIRFGVAPSALGGRHQPRYFGIHRGVTRINHVSDQGTQFWIDVINCQVREATYVLDGLVYQDTYPIKEHLYRHGRLHGTALWLFRAARVSLRATHQRSSRPTSVSNGPGRRLWRAQYGAARRHPRPPHQ